MYLQERPRQLSAWVFTTTALETSGHPAARDLLNKRQDIHVIHSHATTKKQNEPDSTRKAFKVLRTVPGLRLGTQYILTVDEGTSGER